MGLVFVAEQQQPVRRKVALKVIKPGMDTRQVVVRFEAERQALALMDHPHIARVFDGGTAPTGRPFFVMELVKGVPITDFCDQNHLSVRERLELFVSVCQAVQHAHQKAIIHRDLKPSNVLVMAHDGTPLVKVIDFGVAKAVGRQLTDKTIHTQLGQLVGTPLYMSPEQAGQSDLDVDTRSDIYSLGVLLYELLTGTTPFDKERLQEVGFEELRRIIREEEPARPSTRLSTLGRAATTVFSNRRSDPKQLSRLCRGELDWVVMKALEKDRNRRYETASGLAADVQRYLADEPVLACPPSAWYRLRKFARRNQARLAVVAAASLAVTLTAATVGWAVFDRAAREGEKQREQAARQARAANELELALERAELFQGQGKRAEALGALERADVLAAEAPADPAQDGRRAALKERLDAEQRDQEFLARFENIRLSVLSQVNLQKSHFSGTGLSEIRDALAHYGIPIGAGSPGRAAAVIQGRPEPVRAHLVAALDRCLRLEPKENTQARQWLLATLGAADTDAWRSRVRRAVLDHDLKALEPLAREVNVRTQSPDFLVEVAQTVGYVSRPLRVELLRRVQRAYPADLWANQNLGRSLMDSGRPAESVRYLTVAIALRPNNPGFYVNRGFALLGAGEVDEAIADFERTLALAPRYAEAHHGLGNALYAKGRLEQAIAEHREAIRLNKDHWMAHCSLGVELAALGRPGEAIAEYRQSIQLENSSLTRSNLGNALYATGRLEEAILEYQAVLLLGKDNPDAHYNLANALRDTGRLDEAVAEYRAALQLNKNFPEAHCNLGHILTQKGQFREALEEMRRGHELGPRDPRWRYPSAQWVRQCERLVELDGKLPGLLDRTATPDSPGERIELAGLCTAKRLHRAAARFYEEAFAAEPRLATDPGAGHRYNAARAAALATAGQDEDAGKLDGAEGARLRRQALEWLRADLQAWGRRLDQEGNQAGVAAGTNQVLQRWLADADFAGVRGPAALARLPEAERQAWQTLWDDVATTLARARKTLPREKKVEVDSPRVQVGKEAVPPAPAVRNEKDQRAFQVTAVSLRADPENHSGPARVAIRFRGKITADGPGIVMYTFARSDGARGPVLALTFEKAGAKEVSVEWHRFAPCEGWQVLKVLAPNRIDSEKARFKAECIK
jgi:tetratricopeptide (TPR) repeat protein